MLEACASGDIPGGWREYDREVATFGRDVLDAETAPLRDAFNAIVDDDRAAAAAIGERLVAKAAELGALPMEAVEATRTANLYYTLSSGNRGANLERCRQLLERALEIYERHEDIGDRHDRAQVLLNLGAALGSRLAGDPVTNQERAITLQHRVLAMV